MSSQRTSPTPSGRTPLALKRIDGEPLTRSDLQYRFLRLVFDDTHKVFTNPYPQRIDVSDTTSQKHKLTFKELYLATIVNSPKASKTLKDKMQESPLFAEDFGMLALLVNAGRVNTTMSCTLILMLRHSSTIYTMSLVFPEMKTRMRTYHPVPVLQRTQGNLQDAPRIKHLLKAAAIEGASESESEPLAPCDVISRLVCDSVYSVRVVG
jgi:Ino eighty subunit 1